MTVCPDEEAVTIESIECSFACPVMVTQDQRHRLHGLLDEIIRAPWNQPDGRVHWLSEVGSKPGWSESDVKFLGHGLFDPSTDDGDEPTFDDSVLYFGSAERALHDGEVLRRVKLLRRIYPISRAFRGPMWQRLRENGYEICGTWIDECGQGQTKDRGELLARCLSEAAASTLMVMYVEPTDLPLKWAFAEVGAGLAAGVPLALVAPGVGSAQLAMMSQHPLVRCHGTLAAALGDLRRPQDDFTELRQRVQTTGDAARVARRELREAIRRANG